MCAVLFWVVKRYSSPVFGLIAMTFPMVLPPFFYATEARSYGLLLGFSALSALCWLSVENAPARRLDRARLQFIRGGRVSITTEFF